MANPGPATTVTQESFAPMTNVVKGGVFSLTLTPSAVATITTAAQNFASTGIGLVVGDFTKANYVYNSDIQLSINLDGNDFTKNLRTILAEQAIALYVSNNETGAFVLVDDIDQALTDLATA